MFSEETIRQAKTLDLPSYLKSSGLELIPTNGGSSYKALCPFHEEKTPSLSITFKEGEWLWHCFGCDAGGDTIRFIMQKSGLDFRASVTLLLSETGRLPVIEPPNPKKTALTLPERKHFLSLMASHYHKQLLSELGNEAEPNHLEMRGLFYLKRRGLLDESLIKEFCLGYANGKLKTAVAKNQVEGLNDEERVLLRELGLFKQNYDETFAGSVIFPVFDLEGQASEFYGRQVHHNALRSNHCYTKGEHLGLWNHKNVAQADTVILTEGIIDALSIYKAGFKNVTALYGTGGYTQAHDTLFKNGQVKRVVFALDNDKTGREAVRSLAGRLPTLACFVVLFPSEHKDANGVLTALGVETLRDLVSKPLPLKEALAFFEDNVLPSKNLLEALPETRTHTSPPNPTQQEEQKPATSSDKFHFENEDLIHSTEFLTYRVKGVRSLKNLDSLRLVLKAQKGEQTHTDRLDLYLSRSRESFAEILCKNFGLEAEPLEKELQAITEFIEKDFERRKSEETKPPPSQEMSEQDQEEALRFLKLPDLIEIILEHISLLGYVGENENKILLYLCAMSRKLQKPLSVLIRSQSSTGKSFLMDIICRLLPEEDVYKLTGLSQQALYYWPDLKHKFIAIDEKTGMQDAEYPIRSLQSAGKLTFAVPIKNPVTGQIETQQITKEGPIAYVDGSTDTRTNPENANRCFEIFLDESAEQTRRVQEQQRKAYMLESVELDEQRQTIERTHRNAQRLLKPVKVVIPYVDILEFPSDWLRTRRDHDRFLNLIVSIAFLHQYQRPRLTSPQGVPYIEATQEDYALAFKIARVVLFNTFQDLQKPVRDFYKQIVQMTKSDENKNKPHPITFTQNEVRRFTKLPPYLVKRQMRVLVDFEYLDVQASPQGSRFRYGLNPSKLGEFAREDLPGLTSPAELKQKIADQNRHHPKA